MIKKIRVEHLEPGMFISSFNTPWLKHPFFPNQVKINHARDIDRLLRCGIAELHIDTRRGKDSPKAVGLEEVDRQLDKQLEEDVLQEETDAPAFAPDSVPLAREIPKAKKVYLEARKVVADQFHEVRMGRYLDADTAAESVGDMIDSIFRNRNALLSLSRIKSFDQYTFNHSINVAVLALSLAAQLGILDQELRRLGVGAVLHDLGKVRLPDGLVQKKARLDNNEYEMIKTHAAHGAKIILESGSLPRECAAVPLNHHERYDGSGYPRRLAGAKVGKFGLITAIADVYDAMTTNRPYQQRISPDVALRKIYEWAGTHFHPIYVRKFIQCLGIFPVGSVVRLDSGELGVVVRQNRGDLLRPWVRLIRHVHEKHKVLLLDVDLRSPDPSGVKPFARSVKNPLDADQLGIDVDSVLTRQLDSEAEQAERLGAGDWRAAAG